MASDAASPPLVEHLQDVVGSALRSVCTYDEDHYDLLFLRENVDAIYSPEELDEVFRDIRLEGWGRDRLEEVFNAGSLECTMYGFDDAMMVHFVTNGFQGVLVTYDRGAEVDVESVIGACRSGE